MSAASSSAHAPDATLAQAIEWMVRLRSGDASAQEHAAFSNWIKADQKHLDAWTRLTEHLDDTFEPLRASQHHADIARQVLSQPTLKPNERKKGNTTLTLATALLCGAWLLDQYTPLLELSADLHTASGEHREYTLADGSSLTLGARSAADVVFSGQERRVRLRAGELFASVTPDQATPFVVETHEGQVRVRGSSVVVRQEAQRSYVEAFDQDATITTQTGESATLHRGEAIYFERMRVAQPRPIDPAHLPHPLPRKNFS
jgi:transmembrane sensor